MPDAIPTLFLWRSTLHSHWHRREGEEATEGDEIPDFYYKGKSNCCPFCQTTFKSGDRGSEHHFCALCGFHYSLNEGDTFGEGSNYEYINWDYAVLQRFSLNDASVSLSELATHLKRKRTDLFELDPLRFEELVADIYRNIGYSARLTKRSHDGGVDILLFDKNGSQEIVQCKRLAQHRKVSVNVVREILGVQLERGVPRAKIVSTSGFTLPSRQLAAKMETNTNTFQIELRDAYDLISNINCYNELLPPLEYHEFFSNPSDSSSQSA